MKNFEYVMSGLSLTRVINGLDTSPFFPVFVDLACEITADTVSKLETHNQHTTSIISGLYNAFTENVYGKKIQNRRKMGLSNIYADSGGLQIITAGKTITPELKRKVYETQTLADFGFCFDTIPLERVTPVRTKSERSNTSNKLFRVENLVSSAEQTGKDILEQLTYFETSGSHTKGFVIVQGNNPDDMVTWFSTIIEMIPDSLKSRIQGIALADTCMGNGTLETVDMLIAAKRIAEKYGTVYTQHIHLLGVGAINRMLPVILLMKSGYLDFIEHISYDSTTHTDSLIKGRYFHQGKFIDVPAYRAKNSVEFFDRLYARYENIFSRYFSLDKYKDDVVFYTDTWNTSTIINLEDTSKFTQDQHSFIKIIPYAGVLYQVEQFMMELDKVYGRKVTRGDAVSDLVFVKNDDDMKRWFDTCAYSCNSNRISRSDSIVNLTDFLE